MLVLYVVGDCCSLMFLHTLMWVSTREADIDCITQTTLVIINNVLLIYSWKFMFLRLEMSLDLFTHISRLDDGINLSTEIAELFSYRICRFLVFER